MMKERLISLLLRSYRTERILSSKSRPRPQILSFSDRFEGAVEFAELRVGSPFVFVIRRQVVPDFVQCLFEPLPFAAVEDSVEILQELP